MISKGVLASAYFLKLLVCRKNGKHRMIGNPFTPCFPCAVFLKDYFFAGFTGNFLNSTALALAISSGLFSASVFGLISALTAAE